MADAIKGLTVKIGADTSDFVKELKKVDKDIKQTSNTANELQKSLDLEFDEKRFTQAQKQVQSALKKTEEKAEAIRKQLKYLESTGSVDTDGYKKLELELAKTDAAALKLKKQLDDIDKIKFDKISSQAKSLSDGLNKAANATKAISAAAVGAIAGIVKLGSDAAATGGEIQDMADRLGIAAEEVQRYDYIALQSGVETDQLVKSMAKARDAIGTGLAGGTSTAVTALRTLFGDLEKIPTGTEEGFTAIIEQLSEVEDSTLQAYYANEIFGERLATNLIPLINNGADRLNQLNTEFEQIGYLSDEEVKSLADFDDELNIMREELDLAKLELGMAFIPVLKDFANILKESIIPLIQKVIDWFNGLSDSERALFEKTLILVASLSPILSILSKITGILPTVINLLGKLKNMSVKTAAGFAALGGAIVLSLDLISNWKQMSTVEKILKSLAVAALVAAAAVTVFHASWSLGASVGVIAAGVVAGIAAIKAASEDIGIDTDFTDTGSVMDAAKSDYEIPTASGSNGTTTYNEDNSQYEININMSATGDLNYDSKALADEVIKQIIIKKQAAM